jgi:hypothetical protein
MFYESEMKRFSDHANALAYAEKKGDARGVLRTAKNMLSDGVKPALVARYTELPLETVKALR